ncbi:MAG: hypothetical protein K0R65_120 [Crocinitomicaceae bacterium]|jgi:hypothetical protein|nr:hypothetical protein [Crocinitomicaceae bacterium]
MIQDEKNQEQDAGEDFPGYPHYAPEDDIYRKEKEEKEIDPENPDRLKTPNETYAGRNEKNSDDLLPGDDLDVPGSELDDAQEDIGSEDEENNYYSLGDDERDVEENKE